VLAALYCHQIHPVEGTLAKEDWVRFLREITANDMAKPVLLTDTDSQVTDWILEWSRATHPKLVLLDEKEEK
jgi:hypothetical protein